MKQRPRIYYTEEQKALMWDRWQQGDSLNTIALRIQWVDATNTCSVLLHHKPAARTEKLKERCWHTSQLKDDMFLRYRMIKLQQNGKSPVNE